MLAYYVFRAAVLLLGFGLLVCVPAGLFVYLLSTCLGATAAYCALGATAAALLCLARSVRFRVEALRMIGVQNRR